LLLIITESIIVFPGNYNGEILNKINEDWILIENRTFYPASEVFLLPKSDNPAGEIFASLPIKEKMDKSVPIRIVVMGFIKDHPEKKVGAYIDLVLQS
jgi:hypothetical protein